MRDYREVENRRDYFDALYRLNLTQKIMPGLVYLYMPELAARYGWDDEQKLWFAFLNGMTQNPITSLRLFARLPSVPPAGATLSAFTDWFNTEWETLQFDTDRRYQKKDTVQSIKTYAALVAEHGSQRAMLTGKTWPQLWSLVRDGYYTFGRLSAFSYLEYVHLNGFGTDCGDLLFADKSGSKSHRNGILFLLGHDNLVWDKRLPNGQDGNYMWFKKMCDWLTREADTYLLQFAAFNLEVPNVNRFTLESNLCTFKNHFFGHRYPGIYADMAQERIEWADERGQSSFTAVFKEIREDNLPDWLRSECEPAKMSIKEKAALFPATGVPYRADNFLEIQ
jgi:hypothetical protein